MEGGINAWKGLQAEGPPVSGMAYFAPATRPEELIALAWYLKKGSHIFYSELSQRLTDRVAKDLFKVGHGSLDLSPVRHLTAQFSTTTTIASTSRATNASARFSNTLILIPADGREITQGSGQSRIPQGRRRWHARASGRTLTTSTTGALDFRSSSPGPTLGAGVFFALGTAGATSTCRVWNARLRSPPLLRPPMRPTRFRRRASVRPGSQQADSRLRC